MKALLIIDDATVAHKVASVLVPMGMDIIRYRDPVKALDNIEEIQPDAVVMSARDYPRHWKSVVVYARTRSTRSSCVVVLLKGDFFPFDEAAKAAHLGVNGVVRDDLTDQAERLRFQQLFRRYVEVDDSRISDRRPVMDWETVEFAITHPKTMRTILGKVETISSNGLSMIPDTPALLEGLEPGDQVPLATLLLGTRCVGAPCTMARKGAVVAFSFGPLAPADRAALKEWLREAPERELAALLKKKPVSV